MIQDIPDCDARGVPLSVEAARAMTRGDIRAAVIDLLAHEMATSPSAILEGELADDGSPSIKSIFAVYVFSELVLHLEALNITVGRTERKRWSTLNGLIDVVARAFAAPTKRDRAA